MENKILDERSFNYFRLDNEFIDEQSKKCGWQGTIVYTALCRHANKQGTCFPSINTLAKELSVNRKTVMKGLDSLEKRRIITIEKTIRSDGGYSNNVYNLKDKRYWIVDDLHTPQSTTRTTPSVSEGLPLVPEKDSKNTNNKYTNNKELADKSADVGNFKIKDDINSILEEFYTFNPGLNFGNKTQRDAVSFLINKFGKDELLGMIKWYKEKISDRFCPVATTPLAFKNKIGEIMVYAEKLKQPVKGGITII